MPACKNLSSQRLKLIFPLTPRHRVDKLARLMVAPKLRLISPFQLAENQEKLAGSVPVQALARLREAVLSDQGKVNYELRFGKDDQGVVFILGEFSVKLRVTCQRCMQPMDLPLEHKISLAVVNPQDARNIPDCYEPLAAVDNQIALETLLDEEILLAMPIAPVHEQENCNGRYLLDKYKPATNSPFAVLKNLKIEK